MKTATYPLFLKINRLYLAEFIDCERGAHEDGMTGPSPLTTVTILERHKDRIEMRDVNEAAQVLDAARYGTLGQYHPRVADRITEELRAFPDVVKCWTEHDGREWNELNEALKRARES